MAFEARANHSDGEAELQGGTSDRSTLAATDSSLNDLLAFPVNVVPAAGDPVCGTGPTGHATPALPTTEPLRLAGWLIVHHSVAHRTGRPFWLPHESFALAMCLTPITSAFAVRSIRDWWRKFGRTQYAGQTHLLIEADSGGSNGCRPRLWKRELQRLANETGLTITVCHYPRGASKWNPADHRLFGPISRNWSGTPLRDLPTMLGYIRGTRTQTGLRVTAALDKRTYATKIKVPDQEMKRLNIHKSKTCSQWNYTIKPETGFARSCQVSKSNLEAQRSRRSVQQFLAAANQVSTVRYRNDPAVCAVDILSEQQWTVAEIDARLLPVLIPLLAEGFLQPGEVRVRFILAIHRSWPPSPPLHTTPSVTSKCPWRTSSANAPVNRPR